MKTPYDAALRVQQREIDEMSVAISREAGVLAAVEQAQAEASAAVRREADLAGTDMSEGLGIPSHGYFARKRDERRQLTSLQAELSTRLETLRSEAVEAFGTFRTIESAADAFRQEAERVQASAEQAGIDDLAAVAFLKAQRAMRDGQRT
ncbi:hypothetical protein EDF56_10549 [Novosphingobium sp. PhB165]|uniref:hypothetical protein n=1 Tax=Novosphingobium sp. PhB165 TaxID=2485105 RepID=UPI00105230EC|nr:hypothetical protein [Novosphingobium sp. PhB165]TCM17707.1 hypothetical protein EDF56_10549 [Novosphingobium sp. PhB165]